VTSYQRQGKIFSLCALKIHNSNGQIDSQQAREAVRKGMRASDLLTIEEDNNRFILLMDTDREGALAAAERFRSLLGKKESGLRVTVSIAEFPKDGQDAAALLNVL
jgi:GGDEF domain-containing protein